MLRFLPFVCALCAAWAPAIAAQDAPHPDTIAETARGRPYSPCANRALAVEVYFGDVHVHTGLSGDASGAGARIMRSDAYRFARGEQVLSNTGQPVKPREPYDFLAVADHSDGMGTIADVLADFETWDAGNLDLSEAKTGEMLAGEYVREALKRGLSIEARTGVNPCKFGLVESSDIHTGL